MNETIDSFFARGKETAKLLDQKKHLLPRRIISFENVRDLMTFLSENKLNVVAAVRKKPCSLTDLAKILKRSRAAVDKDVQLLESVGIIKSEYVTNPGHGRHKIITPLDKSPIKLQVQTTI